MISWPRDYKTQIPLPKVKGPLAVGQECQVSQVLIQGPPSRCAQRVSPSRESLGDLPEGPGITFPVQALIPPRRHNIVAAGIGEESGMQGPRSEHEEEVPVHRKSAPETPYFRLGGPRPTLVGHSPPPAHLFLYVSAQLSPKKQSTGGSPPSSSLYLPVSGKTAIRSTGPHHCHKLF